MLLASTSVNSILALASTSLSAAMLTTMVLLVSPAANVTSPSCLALVTAFSTVSPVTDVMSLVLGAFSDQAICPVALVLPLRVRV